MLWTPGPVRVVGSSMLWAPGPVRVVGSSMLWTPGPVRAVGLPMLWTLGPGQVAHLSNGSAAKVPDFRYCGRVGRAKWPTSRAGAPLETRILDALNAWAGPGGPPFERERRRGAPDMVCTPLIMLSASRAGWLAVRETIRQNCFKTNRKCCFLAPPRLLGLRRLPAGPGGPAGITASLRASSKKHQKTAYG